MHKQFAWCKSLQQGSTKAAFFKFKRSQMINYGKLLSLVTDCGVSCPIASQLGGIPPQRFTYKNAAQQRSYSLDFGTSKRLNKESAEFVMSWIEAVTCAMPKEKYILCEKLCWFLVRNMIFVNINIIIIEVEHLIDYSRVKIQIKHTFIHSSNQQ